MKWFRSISLSMRPPDLFSLPVLVGTAAELCMIQLASPYRNGHLGLRIVLQILAAFVAFALPYAVFLTLRRRTNEQTLRTALILSLLIGALAAGALLGWTFRAVGLDDTLSLFILRMLATFAHLAVVSLLLWAAVSGVREHYVRLDGLLKEREHLEALAAQASQSLATLDDQASEAVRDRIMQGLLRSDDIQAQELVDRLNATIDDVVRPMSRQLESESAAWIAPVRNWNPDYRINWRTAAIDGMDPTLVRPMAVITILVLIATPMNIVRNGLAFEVQFVLVSSLVSFPLFCLVQRSAVWLSAGRERFARAAIFLVMAAVDGLLFGLALLPFTLSQPIPLRFLTLGPIFVIIVCFIWGMAIAAQQSLRSSEEALRAITEDVAWHVARARELHRQHRRALAHAVHGKVQAALAAGILQLEAALKSGSVSEQLVREVQSRVIDCVQELDLRQVHPSTLNVLLSKMQATWVGVANVSVCVPQDLDMALESDVQCLTTLNDVLPELVFNGIKHGKATEITIEVARPNPRTLRVVVSDNGRSLINSVSGMGSRLLDETSIEWTRARLGELTVTSILFPFAPFGLTDQIAIRFEGEPLGVFP